MQTPNEIYKEIISHQSQINPHMIKQSLIELIKQIMKDKKITIQDIKQEPTATLTYSLKEIRNLQKTLAHFKGKSHLIWHDKTIQNTINKILKWDKQR